MGEQEQKSIIE